jgi:hypothetical protein
MAETVLSMVKGTRRDFQLTMLDESGAVAAFLGTEALAAQIWGGGTTAPLATPAVTWISAPAGTIRLSITAADQASLEDQPYPIRVYLTAASGDVVQIWAGWVAFTPTPGASAVVPVYGTYRDMADHFGPGLDRLMMASTYTGFRRERAKARETLDSWILARFKRPSWGYDLQTFGSWSGGIHGPDPTVKAWLADDCLMIEPRTVEIASRLALAYVLQKANEDELRAQAGGQYRQAVALGLGYVAQLDTNADGNADLSVDLGLINFRD